MKILKSGNRIPVLDGYEGWKAIVACKKTSSDPETEVPGNPKPCGAEFEVQESDIELMYYKRNYGTKVHYMGIHCPECRRLHMLAALTDIPDPVRNRFNARKLEAKWDKWQDGNSGINVSLQSE